MKGVLPWLVRWACWAGTRDFCPTLAALVGPVQNIIFLIAHYSVHLSPTPSKLAGSHAAPPVSSYVSGFFAYWCNWKRKQEKIKDEI
jgi:hypothetical protein